MKTLVIVYYKNAYFFPYISNQEIIISDVINNQSKIAKLLFRLPFFSRFSYDFRQYLDECDSVVVFDNAYNYFLVDYLSRVKKKTVYLYFWNPIKKMYGNKGDKIVKKAKRRATIYSFDHNDCENYQLKFASMVYSKEVARNCEISKKEDCLYDVFFLGWKKDRYDLILDIYKDLLCDQFKCEIVLVGEKDEKMSKHFKFTDVTVSYTEYIKKLLVSRAVLDIPQKNQEGLTIRNVECMFLKKKLITTKKDIVKYDFYNPNNIFIIGQDDNKQLSSFLSSDFEEISPEILKKYDFEFWVEQFGC